MAEEKKIPEETKAPAVPITDPSEVRGIPKTIFIVLFKSPQNSCNPQPSSQ